MDSKLNHINVLIEHEIGLYESLRALLVHERSAVSRRSLTELDAVQKEKEQLLPELKAAESRRQALLAEIAVEIGVAREDLSLRKLADFAPNSRRAELVLGRDRLLETVKQAVAENRRCSDILRLSLEVTKTSVDFLNRLMAPRAVYTPYGRVAGKESGGRILSGAV